MSILDEKQFHAFLHMMRQTLQEEHKEAMDYFKCEIFATLNRQMQAWEQYFAWLIKKASNRIDRQVKKKRKSKENI